MLLDYLKGEEHIPTLDEWLKLKEYLEGSLAFKRKEQRARRKAKIYHPWIDQRIDDSIKMDCLTLQFVDQLIIESRELEKKKDFR
jgi:hypothetical protein